MDAVRTDSLPWGKKGTQKSNLFKTCKQTLVHMYVAQAIQDVIEVQLYTARHI